VPCGKYCYNGKTHDRGSYKGGPEDLPNQRSARVPYSGAPEITPEDC
jgi:hypothetical protein